MFSLLKMENGNILGKGTCSRDAYSVAVNSDGKIVYTDRILLENVDKDTKEIFIEIYEQWDGEGALDMYTTRIHLDIESARNNKNKVDLTQSYASKEQQVSFKYPANWEVREEENILHIIGPEDIDGKSAQITLSIYNGEQSIEEIVEQARNEANQSKYAFGTGKLSIAGVEGTYYQIKTENKIEGRILVENEGVIHDIQYTAISTQYERNKLVIQKILESIEWVEPEKSYKTFVEGNIMVKLYEDNTLGIVVMDGYINAMQNWSTKTCAIKENTEYAVNGNIGEILNVQIETLFEQHPVVLVHAVNEDLYYINMVAGIEQGTFNIAKVEGLPKVVGTGMAGTGGHTESKGWVDLVVARDNQYYDLYVDDFNSGKVVARLCDHGDGRGNSGNSGTIPWEEELPSTGPSWEEEIPNTVPGWTEDLPSTGPSLDLFSSYNWDTVIMTYSTSSYDVICQHEDYSVDIMFGEDALNFKEIRNEGIQTDWSQHYDIYGLGNYEIETVYRIATDTSFPAYVFVMDEGEEKSIVIVTIDSFFSYYFTADKKLNHIDDIITDSVYDFNVRDKWGNIYRVKYDSFNMLDNSIIQAIKEYVESGKTKISGNVACVSYYDEIPESVRVNPYGQVIDVMDIIVTTTSGASYGCNARLKYDGTNNKWIVLNFTITVD